jgi:hypothetical protein
MGRKYKGDFLISLLKVVTITLFCADYGNCTELPEATPTGNPLCTFSDNKNDNGSSFILVSAALDAYTLAKSRYQLQVVNNIIATVVLLLVK